MKLLEHDIEDGDRLHADHQTSDAPVSRDSFEPAPAVDDAEEEEMQNYMKLLEQGIINNTQETSPIKKGLRLELSQVILLTIVFL